MKSMNIFSDDGKKIKKRILAKIIKNSFSKEKIKKMYLKLIKM